MIAARPVAAVCLLGAAVGTWACGGGGRQPQVPTEAAAPEEQPAGTEAKAPAAAPLRRAAVTLYFPSERADGMAGEIHEIFDTASPVDRAKQILSDLISGPTGEGALPALPAGTRLRQVYLLQDGTAWADLSSGLREGMAGGSTTERMAVYSIVNSLVLNVPEIRRVGILIEGRPCPTLNGHMDLTRPLPPDMTLLPSGAGGPGPAGGTAESRKPGPARSSAGAPGGG